MGWAQEEQDKNPQTQESQDQEGKSDLKPTVKEILVKNFPELWIQATKYKKPERSQGKQI